MTLKELILSENYFNTNSDFNFNKGKKNFIKYLNTLSLKELNDLASECDQLSLEYIKSNQKLMYEFFNNEIRKLIESAVKKNMRGLF
ncbi:MAG: hypothetical protein GTO02_07840 [Candidatus Dadabacteria bacterium]|nr:hypothetical protein [Candidatus Dadabacteria bacterium]